MSSWGLFPTIGTLRGGDQPVSFSEVTFFMERGKEEVENLYVSGERRL